MKNIKIVTKEKRIQFCRPGQTRMKENRRIFYTFKKKVSSVLKFAF